MSGHQRMPLPALISQAPLCPVDGEPVHWDGRFQCPKCRATWGTANYDDTGRANVAVEQCSAEVQPYPDAKNISHFRYRCVKDTGHDADPNLISYHVGLRSDGAQGSGDMEPCEWQNGDYPLAVGRKSS